MLSRSTVALIAVLTAVALTIVAGCHLYEEMRNIYPSSWPTVPTTARYGDTWWTVAENCDGDRRAAISYLAEVSGVDANDPLMAGQMIYECDQ